MQTEKKAIEIGKVVIFQCSNDPFSTKRSLFPIDNHISLFQSECFERVHRKKYNKKKEGKSLLTKMTSPNNNTAAQQHNLASMNFMASSSTPDDKNGICNNPLEVGGSSSSFFIPGLRPLYPLHPGTYPYSLLSPSEMSQFSPW